jgi:hypothetical protein
MQRAAREAERQRIRKMIEEATNYISATLESKAQMTADLEMQKIETTALQRQYETLYNKLAEADMSLNSSAGEVTEVAREKQLRERDFFARNLAEVSKKLRTNMEDTQRQLAELEKVQLNQAIRERHLEGLQRIEQQLEFPPAEQPAISGQVLPAEVAASISSGKALDVAAYGSEKSPADRRQLELEREAYLLKAKALQEKSRAISARLPQLQEENAISSIEAVQLASDALAMQADAKLAEAKALEIAKRLEALQSETQPEETLALMENAAQVPDALRPGDVIDILLSPRDANEAPKSVRARLDAKGQVTVDPDFPPVELAGIDPHRAGVIIRDFFGTPTSRYQSVQVRRTATDSRDASAVDDKKDLNAKMSALQAENADLRKRLDQMTSQVRTLSKEIEPMDAAKSRTDAKQLEEVRRALSDLQRYLVRSEAENAELKKKLEAADAAPANSPKRAD